jgi:hypothetical protein
VLELKIQRVKWLLDKFRSFILTVNSRVFFVHGFKKTILVGMLAWAIVMLCSPMEMVVI